MRRLSHVGPVLAGAFVLALFALSASAAAPGKWTQITHQHNGARSNLGLARGKDGVLHVLWAGPNRAPFPSILDTTVTPKGALGKPKAVISGWSGVNAPTAATASDGSIHAIVSGQKVGGQSDPYDGLNEVVGPGTWKLGPRAFGNLTLTEASNADVHTAFLKSGQLISVWQSAAALLIETGTDPVVQPQNITPQGLATNPVIAVDQGTGEAIIAYHGVNDGQNYFRRVAPSVGAPQAIPQSKGDGPTIAARAGGGVFTAYARDVDHVVLLQYGGKSRKVPVAKGARVLTAGVAAGPEGRLWVFYGDEQSTYVTRTSRHVTGWEPVQRLKSPPKTAQYFRLEGEGSAGPLDLFADVTVDGKTKDGSYHTHVEPKLSLRASKKALKGGATQVTVRVTDAGDPMAGAKVKGLPGGTKTTTANGSVTVTVKRSGAFALTATKAGYVAAKGRITV